LEILAHSLGEDHLEVGFTRANLAFLLTAVGRSQEAVEEAFQALSTVERALGLNHSWTKHAASAFADALEESGQNRKAAAIRARYEV
jgi:hypothetical protein